MGHVSGVLLMPCAGVGKRKEDEAESCCHSSVVGNTNVVSIVARSCDTRALLPRFLGWAVRGWWSKKRSREFVVGVSLIPCSFSKKSGVYPISCVLLEYWRVFFQKCSQHGEVSQCTELWTKREVNRKIAQVPLSSDNTTSGAITST